MMAPKTGDSLISSILFTVTNEAGEWLPAPFA
jgi:hypothetical protein